jgi:predicted DNA-binding ribbon-helix-helix protein
MSTLSLRLPESLHRRLAEVAAREGVSINQLISSAVAEKMSALLTEEYLEKRAKRGSRARFASALAKVPDVKAESSDKLPVRTTSSAAEPSTARDEPAPTRRTRARR